MRRARHLSPSAETSSSLYHCVDRIVNRDHVLGRVEKNMFVYLMRKYAAFHDVSVLSFCIMDNHFHLLVEVPPKKKGAPVPMEDDEFLAKLEAFASRAYYNDIKQMLTRFRAGGSDQAAEELKAKHTCRMKDLSCFMQGLKRRFSQWFNKTHCRTGTLWEGRFKSVLVEHGYAARVMSSYIDLNPIRAGMVSRPEDYRWSSYGVSMSPKDGDVRDVARAGLCRVMQLHREMGGRISPGKSAVLWEGDWVPEGVDGCDGTKNPTKNPTKNRNDESSGSEWYRMMLFADGEEVFTARPAQGVLKMRVRKGFNRKEVKKVLARGGKLSFGEALRCKMRYLTDGMVFGSQNFVNGVFQGSRSHFSEQRKTGARPIRGVGWKEPAGRLYSMRELKKNVLE